MSCSCSSGVFECSCCCSSVTNIKGGLHPDSIQSVWKDLVIDDVTAEGVPNKTFLNEILLREPSHIVGVDVSLMSIQRYTATANSAKQLNEAGDANADIRTATPINITLFTVPGYASENEPGSTWTLEKGGFYAGVNEQQKRTYICTGSVSSHSPSWTAHEDLFGFFADGGLFVELNSPSRNYGVRVVVRYVPRLQFSPAYHDPLTVMQHYWQCSHGATGEGAEFLEGFYSGTALNFPSTKTEGTEITPAASSELSSIGSNPLEA